MTHEERDDVGVVFCHGPVERRVELVVGGVDVRAGLEKQEDDVLGTCANGKVKGRLAVDVLRVGVRAVLEEERDKGHEAVSARKVKGRDAAQCRLVDVCAVVEHGLDNVESLADDGLVQVVPRGTCVTARPPRSCGHSGLTVAVAVAVHRFVATAAAVAVGWCLPVVGWCGGSLCWRVV